MQSDVVAMVLVGGRGTRLGRITKHTAKPAVTFAAKYKLIDFVLSNIANSGIKRVGLVTQYEPYELMEYIGHGSTWDLDINEGGVQFLTPYTSVDGDMWQKGTSHAIEQHFRYIEASGAKHVLILGGDHVYKMDYNKIIDHHKETNADITISAFDPNSDYSRFGIIEINEKYEVVGFEEKPDQPKANLASMGIYCFKTSVLKQLLKDASSKQMDFGKDIIPLSLIDGYHVYAYRFNGYFRDVGTIQSLFDANMDCIDYPHLLKLQEYKELPLYTKSSNLPPHHIVRSNRIEDAMIADGCLIYGEVIHSVISSGVLIKDRSKIINSIIFANAKIGEDCTIENAIILENSVVLSGTELVFDEVTVVDNEYLWKLGDSDE